jgi:hypothetical protein
LEADGDVEIEERGAGGDEDIVFWRCPCSEWVIAFSSVLTMVVVVIVLCGLAALAIKTG